MKPREPSESESADRQHMLKHNLETGEIQSFYERYLARGGSHDPVILLLDLNDSVAFGLAAAIKGKKPMKAHKKRVKAKRMAPTVIVVMERPAARALLGLNSSAMMADALDHPAPMGHVHVVVVASRGKSLAVVPLDSSNRLDDVQDQDVA